MVVIPSLQIAHYNVEAVGRFAISQRKQAAIRKNKDWNS
jgi:hypothetical protein